MCLTAMKLGCIFVHFQTKHSQKGQPSKSTKESKDKLTVLFACNATGEKIRRLVIGRANPRCLKNVKREGLGVDYTAYTKAWMNNNVFNN